MFRFMILALILIFSFHTFGTPVEPECGISDHPHTPSGHRIIDGVLVEKGELPWIIFVKYSNATVKDHPLCSGSIIAKNYVLFARHCFRGEGATYHVRAGVVDKRDTSAVIINTTIVHLPPNDGGRNDIAILELPEPFTFNENIRPMCLKKNFDETSYKDLALISGFGAKKWFPRCRHEPCPPHPEAYDGKLRKGTSLFVAPYDCEDYYENLDPEVDICEQGQNGTEIFKGDSGSPIVIKNPPRPDGKVQWTQVGVCSRGHGAVGIPKIFTRVSHNCEWIADVTKNAAKCS
ncbi:trypsin domain-containing protein [Ditylenchus destructor]|uniref:Trypsin domain-containing protein n=1 Tax=Ditylenchus destructor TaxID=166010 RepID=A0AAD4R568_9BILA|nr:trypsin domain-containing protein [Ditylenchus destructor]